VLEHNRLDLLSLALLTARAVQLLDEGAAATDTPREALGLGRLYERAGMTEDALQCYTRASDLGPPLRADALRAYALLARRARRFSHAAQAWERLLGLDDCPPHMEREAAEALAVHHEHRLRSLVSARTLALRSLNLNSAESRRRAAEHRLARLERKIEFRESTLALF
jgi:tetratricopeptide (TPR) repeat protein